MSNINSNRGFFASSLRNAFLMRHTVAGIAIIAHTDQHPECLIGAPDYALQDHEVMKQRVNALFDSFFAPGVAADA